MYWSQSYSLQKKTTMQDIAQQRRTLEHCMLGIGEFSQFLPKHIRLSLAAVRRQTTYLTLPKRTEKKLSLVRPTDPLKLPFVNVRSALRGIFIAHFIKAIVLQLERML
jgi:hypothetical protein